MKLNVRFLVFTLVFCLLSTACPAAVFAKEKKQAEPTQEEYKSKFMEYGRMQSAQYQYEKEKKSATTAVLLNIILYPGLGNLYAGGYITGTLELAWWFNFVARMNAAATQAELDALQPELSAIFIIALVTAYTDVSAHNNKLMRKLGLSVSMRTPPGGNGVMLALQKRF